VSEPTGPIFPPKEDRVIPPPPPPPSSIVLLPTPIEGAPEPGQTISEDPPTHALWREASVEFVNPSDYAGGNPDLVPIEEGWCGPFMVPDFANRTFVPDLDAARAWMWERVKARRAQLETSTAPTPFGAVQIDEKSKTKISGLALAATIALAAGAPFEEEFTIANNSVVVLDAEAAQAMGLAVAAHISAIYAVARDLRAQIDAPGQSLAEVLGVDVDGAPWPAEGEG